MSSIGTFGAFTTARLGIYAAQLGLNVTGNNIANINTYGYTRQNLDQISLRTGVGDRYQSAFDVRIGNGVLPTGVSQIRDPYLDIRYRTESASVGSMNTKLEGLNELAAILDEVGLGDEKNGLIHAQFGDLLEKLQNLSTNTNQGEFDTQVRSSVEALVTLFNSYAGKLEQLQENTISSFKEDIKRVNDILANIADLNAQIRKSDIHGDSALEMRDERNRLIDELSQYMKIDVEYSYEDLGAGVTVEKLTIKLGNANPDGTVTSDSSVLVDGAYATQIGIDQIPQPNPDFDPDDPAKAPPYLDPDGNPTNDPDAAAKIDNPNYNLTLSGLKDSKGKDHPDANLQVDVPLDDNDLYGALQSKRELLTEEGEFTSQDTINNVDENAATKRGIPYYQKSLDLLANKLASVFNEANQGYMVNEKDEYIDKNGNVILDNAGNPVKKEVPLSPATEQHLINMGAEKVGGPLFSNKGDGDDTTGITAGNISVSHSWATGDVHIVSSFTKVDGVESSTANSNILHMISLLDKKMDYNPQDIDGDAESSKLFNGTFQEMLVNISGVLGNDQNSTNVKLNTYYNSAIELDTSRSSISGVDLNDEATNLMQYQKSYSAACRLMTTLDQVLDKLINGTGTAGL